MKATLDGVVVAESETTVKVDGNHYFPRTSLMMEFFGESDKTTRCGWKGTASYYHLSVNGSTHKNIAWTYNEPLEAASEIKEHVAFYSKVKISEE